MLNAILQILHEIDSAYWKEWKLFKLPGGINGFLLLHVPLLLLILYGLVGIERQSIFGWVASLIISAAGMFAFCIHMTFIRRGRQEFDTPISRLILSSMLLVSIAQATVTLYFIAGLTGQTCRAIVREAKNEETSI